MADDDYNVRSVLRGLNIVEVLNRRNGASLTDVIAATGLSRGTAYRILETLRHAGYITREGRGGYWLCAKVRTLSDGYHEESWFQEIAQPRLDMLAKEVGWPVSLVTAVGTDVIVRASVETPLTFVHFPIGSRFPMLDTASGQWHLAFVTPRERGLLLELIHRSAEDSEIAARKILTFTKALGRVQSDRYVLSPTRDSKYTNFAVPIFSRRRNIACLAMRFPSLALKRNDIEAKYLAILQRCARDIGLAFDATAP